MDGDLFLDGSFLIFDLVSVDLPFSFIIFCCRLLALRSVMTSLFCFLFC